MDVKELENKVENLAGQVTAKDSQISDLENKVSEKDSLIAEMENKASEKDTQIAELKSQVESFENKEKDAAVDSAIKSGKFSEDNRTGLTEQVKVMGVENFNKMVEMAALPTANALSQVNNNSGEGESKKSPDDKLAAEFENLAQNNPAELERIKNVEPARFEKMLEAWNK